MGLLAGCVLCTFTTVGVQGGSPRLSKQPNEQAGLLKKHRNGAAISTSEFTDSRFAETSTRCFLPLRGEGGS